MLQGLQQEGNPLSLFSFFFPLYTLFMPFFTAFLLLVFTVPSVSASSWQKLLDSTNALENVLTESAAEMDEEEVDFQGKSDATLFPIDTDQEDKIDEDEISLSGTHLTIKVDGVGVVLDDVPLLEWFAPYVRDSAERKLVSGYRDTEGRPTGLFGPGDPVTIEQLAKMAVVASKIDTLTCQNTLLSETATFRWSEPFVRCAEDRKWAVFADGSVDVQREATREEVVVTVLQAFNARISARQGDIFSDVDSRTVYAGAVETAAGARIVSGYSDRFGNPTGEFGPEDPVNRAETAKIFSLAFQVYGGF